MKITKKQLEQLVRKTILESDNNSPYIPMVKTGSVFKDAIKALQDAGFKKAALGRTKVGDDDKGYGYQQNKDVFASGPFRADLRNYFKQDPKGSKLGDYYYGKVYGRGDIDRKIFKKYTDIIKSFKFKKSAYGLKYKKPMTLFDINKKYIETKDSQDKNAYHYKLGTESLNKLLSVILETSPNAFLEIEKLWVDRVKNSDPSVGTHYNGGAFDLKGYNNKTPSQKLSKIKKVINKAVEQYQTSIVEFGPEKDHIHIGLKK